MMFIDNWWVMLGIVFYRLIIKIDCEVGDRYIDYVVRNNLNSKGRLIYVWNCWCNG